MNETKTTEMQEMQEAQETKAFNRTQVEMEVTQLLLDIGGNPGIKGYHYGREIISELILTAQKTGVGSIFDVSATKEMYPMAAKLHESTPSRVERAIRHFIEQLFERGNHDKLNEVFSASIDWRSGKVTNKTFCIRMAEYTLLEMRKKAGIPTTIGDSAPNFGARWMYNGGKADA